MLISQVFTVRSRDLSASAGGHLTEIAFSLVLVHDYLMGRDFYPELGGRIHTEMKLITMENTDRYLAFLTDENWDAIDFRRFSRIYSTGSRHYDFSIEHLLKQ